MIKPKPPYLKEKKVLISLTLTPGIRALLKEASRATGLSQSAYVERSLSTQFGIDHLT